MSEVGTDSVSCSYRVIYGDTDQMGIVYYANYLRFFERGRCEFMRARGIAYQDVEAAGFILPVVEANVRYRSSARFDDLLTIETWVERTSRVKVFFAYAVWREPTGPEGAVVERELLAEGTTVHACLNREGRPARLPTEFVKRPG